ncbi:hypothetical protein [Algisphaera agarilytica]|uniref:Uncharacterized protein n=1 Tax=Algisphaera agarilytica TaxID=1385975 RepID=A0A7X0H3S8_9BACT|nr:hypothetical protein [Algisphaera agarilytica]MBB6428757.1 hypothetical protein [Algisphaera agarilytica]
MYSSVYSGTGLKCLSVLACLVWGLALSGCTHPLAQRSASQWKAVRVLDETGDVTDRDATLKKNYDTTMVFLLRETQPPTTPEPPEAEIARATVYHGDMIGFVYEGGQTIAVAGSREWEITPEPGVHYVWYCTQDTGDDLATGALQVVGVVLVLGGLLFLNSLDDDDDDCDYHRTRYCSCGKH